MTDPLARAAAALDACLDDAGIGAHVTYGQRGPRCATLDIDPDDAADVDRITRMGRVLAVALGVRRVRLAETTRGVACEVELPRALWTGLTVTQLGWWRYIGERVAIGTDARGTVVTVNLGDPATPHLFVVGATGSGKTTALQALLWQLAMNHAPEELALVLIDGLAHGLLPFAALPHLAEQVTTTAVEGAALIARLQHELDARIADPKRRTPLVVVVDEVAQVTAGNDAAGAGLARIAATGRGLAVHLILATQHATANVVNRLVSANITTRLVGKVADAAASRLAMGSDRDDARTLAGAGDMLLCRGDDVRRVQCPVITEGEWAMLPKGERAHRLDVTADEPILTEHPAGCPDDADVDRVAALWDGGGMPGIMRVRRVIGCGDSRARRLRAAAAERVGHPGIPASRGEGLTRAHAGATTTGARDG